MEEYRGLIIALSINAALGLACFEWAWYKTRRFRNPIQELSETFPDICRSDAPKWKKWKHYPGALTVLVPRFLIGILSLVIAFPFLKLFMCCHNPKNPQRGLRLFLMRMVAIAMSTTFALAFFTVYHIEYATLEDVEHYEEYLGPILAQ